MRLLPIFVSFLLTQTGFSYTIIEKPFTELLEIIPIGPHFENFTVYHELYEGIGYGTLPLSNFKAYIQQSDLYMNHYFATFEILAKREKDPERTKYLQSIANKLTKWTVFYEEIYSDFAIERTKLMVPETLDYAGKQRLFSVQDDLGVALATTTPSFTLWTKIGAHWRTINPAILEQNPYRKFVEQICNEISDDEFGIFINGYYDRLDETNSEELIIMQRMLDAYIESVEMEYRFASSLFMANPINSSLTNFTDLTPLISSGIQKQMIEHVLWDEIARGTLPLQTYEIFMQQDYLYNRGYYAAYHYMERKEADLDRKEPLRKNGQDYYDFFESEFNRLNLVPAAASAPYVLEYNKLEMDTARDRPVSEGVCGTYACFFLWFEFGKRINEIADTMPFAPHPYRPFLDTVNPVFNEPSMRRAQAVINYYYEQETLEGKYRMLQVIRQSIFRELDFANGVYGQQYQI